MKKTYQFFSFLAILLITSFSCGKEDSTKNDAGTDIGLKLLWSHPISQNNINSYVDIVDQAQYNNAIVFGDAENGQRKLKMIDIRSKEIKWTWDEFRTNRFHLRNTYQFDKYLLRQTDDQSYCIDLETGKSVFNIKREREFNDDVVGIGKTFFLTTNNEENEIYIGNVENGEIKPFLKPNYEREFPITVPAYKRHIYPISPIVYNGDTLLVIPFIEPFTDENGVTPKISTYNISKKKWLYENIKIKNGGFYNTIPHGIKIYKGRIYATSGNTLGCFDLLTGEVIWRNEDVKHAFAYAFGGIHIYDDKVIANAEDGKLHAFNLDTGKEIWSLAGVGGADGYVQYHNGYLYLLGSGSGTFFIVNAQNGTVALKSKAPKDGDGYWQSRIVILPQKDGKGKVMLATYKNLFLYETYN
jgi:outer membrane protein assembly factor BamB